MKYKVGQVVQGIITGIQPYGAFVKIDDETSGLIHISEISNSYVSNVQSFVKQGEKIVVKIIDIDRKNSQLRLSLKAIQPPRKKRVSYRIEKQAVNQLGFNVLRNKLPEWIAQEEKKNETGSV